MDVAVGTVLGELEDLVVDVLCHGGGASGPDVVVLFLLVDGVEAVGGTSVCPGADLSINHYVEGGALPGGVGDGHLAVSVE